MEEDAFSALKNAMQIIPIPDEFKTTNIIRYNYNLFKEFCLSQCSNSANEINNQENWIPISAITLGCKKFCCKRTMLPVTVAKADSCYCLQGLTAGDKQIIKRVLLHWSVSAEGLWPNLFYVGASRAEEKHNFALANDISESDLVKIGTYPSVKKQQDELADLAAKAMVFRLEINATKSAFKIEIQWVIDKIKDLLLLIPETDNLRKEITIRCLEQWQKSFERE